jgi:ribosomal peptide maturation radical SAM protein 1
MSLTFSHFRPLILGEKSGSCRAANPLLLLDHPSVDLDELTPDFQLEVHGKVEKLQQQLEVELRRRRTGSAARKAIAAEIARLGTSIASLALERDVSVIVQRNHGGEEPKWFRSAAGGHDLLAIVQQLDARSPGDAARRYREALSNPRGAFLRDGRRALVAWGPPATVRRAIGKYLRQGAVSHPAALTVLLCAKLPPEARQHVSPNRFVPSPNGLPVDKRDQVLLVNAPFATVENPCLGLSLLRQTLPEPRPGIAYLTIPFAEAIGPALYDWIALGEPFFQGMLGEWVFAHALKRSQPTGRYFAEVLCRETLDWFDRPQDCDRRRCVVSVGTVMDLVEAAGLAKDCVDDWASEIVALRPRVVGFTSIFQQNASSLSIARSVKERLPDTKVVFGGSSFEGEMGQALLSAHDWVDVVVSGEAELVFPELVSRLLAGRDPSDLPGVYTRGSRPAKGTAVPNAPRPAPDEIPEPQFDDFFEQWNASPIRNMISPRLLFESSRGCWYGAKQHCTFCGLNGKSMAFRSKPPERVLREIRGLIARYPRHQLAAVDSILDMEFFSTVLPELAKSRLEASLFYEIKANLNRNQIELLKAARVENLQPGIESLSDHVLKLMAKGVTALQNVQSLKWFTEHGIIPYWNILWGFPGETVQDYDEMRRAIPLLVHLIPPSGTGPIRLDRFSPNYFAAREHGFRNIRAVRGYSFIFDVPAEELDRIAYFFEYDYVEQRPAGLDEAIRLCWQEFENWRAVHEQSRLIHFVHQEDIVVFDSRPCAEARLQTLERDDRAVLLLCDSARSTSAVEEAIGDASRARRAIAALEERKLLLRVGERIVSLSLDGEILNREKFVAAEAIERPAA